MAQLKQMPPVSVHPPALKQWGDIWKSAQGRSRNGEVRKKRPQSFDKAQGIEFGKIFDSAFGNSLATMLGEIPVVSPSANALTPEGRDCVEVGNTRIIGGIRPQNYDAAYRPDGPRVVFDSKTLNDQKSIGKNWQNMVNDLASEAATVHIRFPFCIVAFIVVVPAPALLDRQYRAIASTLERLGSRRDELDQHHLAEAIAFVIWNPDSGEIRDLSTDWPSISLSSMHQCIQAAYLDRYQHLPPHIQ
ncbi:MAG: hypothetical protein OXF72_01200 [Gammaproteobacteria bacterium]|nr:hypothetical protein [Gammaproteobacteria bacterium]MCY4278589.1 hypothetical protein [Gammaproteobacteria bacterium]